MALFKNPSVFVQSADAAFDVLYNPGSVPAYSGIFRCNGCGHEVVGEHTRSLPPQNHHQHSPAQGSIRWQMTAHPQSR